MPFTNDGAFGIGVIGAKARILDARYRRRTSCSPTLNAGTGRGALVSSKLSPAWASPPTNRAARVVRSRQHLSRAAFLDVQDERDAPVSEDGRAGHALDAPVVGLEALHHDLSLAHELVDQESEPAAARLDQTTSAFQGSFLERVLHRAARVGARAGSPSPRTLHDLAVPGDRPALFPVRPK